MEPVAVGGMPSLAPSRAHRSFNLRTVDNGFIVECHGDCQYKQFVFYTREELFKFLAENL